MDATAAVEAGFPEVSRWIADDGDGEAFVFRKFDRLAARNLLYLQARMLALEEKIDRADGATSAGGGQVAMLRIMRNWETVVDKSQDPNVSQDLREKCLEQIRLHEELSRLMKEYHEALGLQSRISSLSRPNRRVLGTYRAWLESANTLKGLSAQFLDDKLDLVALKQPEDRDHLSEMLRHVWPAKSITSASGVRIAHFHEKSISTWANAISTLVALALLVGSIVCLHFLGDLRAKFAMIAAFAAFFALSLGVITSARRPEVFAATAAYAAVLVVFVSNQDLTSQSGT
ncbi:hypothetical protein GGTG_13008 [Gaeumannomyces tritici R3-111a-1]|uniref:DUF6594 domain-containing protein n=1 Tax=Gaeumannomyces tritici (strain R3-111a-1) TaxID=644352 RepID=J3PHM8_GAET3|nr:hypothetical protein GGTG_13008 [Gaeumannomyces tritici R3-111a-1]EJT69389.1 hypothetical protein GGTG_13008 [Gaeumannomyces tritici R3-111a-1]